MRRTIVKAAGVAAGAVIALGTLADGAGAHHVSRSGSHAGRLRSGHLFDRGRIGAHDIFDSRLGHSRFSRSRLHRTSFGRSSFFGGGSFASIGSSRGSFVSFTSSSLFDVDDDCDVSFVGGRVVLVADSISDLRECLFELGFGTGGVVTSFSGGRVLTSVS